MQQDAPILLPTEKITIRDQIGREMTEEEFQTLKRSIEKNGILYPIKVVYHEANDEYRVLDGRHRLRAAMELKMKYVPCMVVDSFDVNLISANIYDVEICRKSYTPEEIKHLTNEKEKMTARAEEHAVSILATKAFSSQSLKNLIGTAEIKDEKTFFRFVKTLDNLFGGTITSLQSQLEQAQKERQELEIKLKLLNEEKQREVEQELQAKIRALQGEIQRRINEEVEKRLQEELEKRKLTSTEEKQLRAALEKEISEKIHRQYQQEMDALQADLEDLRRTNAELSKAYKEAREREERLILELNLYKKQKEESEEKLQLYKTELERQQKALKLATTVDALMKTLEAILDQMDAAEKLLARGHLGSEDRKKVKAKLQEIKNRATKLYDTHKD